MLTREPGASDFLLLDAVTYANSAKSQVLGVDEETIRWHGAVSPEVACAMAVGARRVCGADAVGCYRLNSFGNCAMIPPLSMSAISIACV